jgi:hypothetical protein
MGYSPVEIFIFDSLFSMGTASTRKKGAELSPSHSLALPASTIVDCLFLLPTLVASFSFMSSRILLSQLAHAPFHSTSPVSLRSLYEKAMKYFYTRQRKESWLTKMKSKKKAGNNNV